MSWLEKMGLVEREEVIAPVMYETMPEIEMVDAEINSAENVVDEIYAQNNLSDKSNSIYTVQALIDTLPDEMTTAKKQSTVAGILLVSGKSVAELMDDATKRIDTLRAAQEKIVGERTNEIAAANADIEELKKAIEMANLKIKEAEDIIAATKKSVEDELDAIGEMVKFCEGMENKE